jgi:uncharacterized protein YjbJ (UPF0337 family)
LREVALSYARNGAAPTASASTAGDDDVAVPTARRSTVNSNQIKGKAKDIAGKAQEQFGKATGSTTQQAKGLAKQVEGKVQKGAGDLQDAAGKAEKETR